MASELCMNCFSVKGQYEVCPFCGYVEGTKPKQPHYLTPGTILANHFIVGNAIGFGGFGIQNYKIGRKKHEKNIIYSNIIGGFADGGINCTGSSAGSYNVALF
mgnify:CR=1 FL=1